MLHRRFLFLVLALLPCLLPVTRASSSSLSYRQSLIQKAQDLKLDEDHYWHTLLHYRARLFGGYRSEIDAPRFFNAAQGRTSPRAELQATLERFFEPDSQCLFADRYEWLKQKLAFDPALLPEQPCKDYKEWRAALNPESVTLVFSAYYMNNPSSMFGHTLLRLNQSRHSNQDRLLDYGVNYAANPTTNNAFLYGLLGMTGGFPGVFSNIPYYLKVQEYSDMESRDLWEYDLDLTADQVNRLMLHLWTVGHVEVSYYFFDKNCSYMMLTLLDAANPELRFGDQLDGKPVIPSDTVRALSRVKGLVKQVHIRPAIATRINQQRSRLDGRQDSVFRALIHSLDPAKRAESLAAAKAGGSESAIAILDVSLDYLRLLKIRAKNKLTEEEQALQSEILLARSELPISTQRFSISDEEIERTRPDGGHETARLSVGGGYNSGPGSYTELSWRATFHDLNANSQGYPRNAEVELLNARLRYYPSAQKLRVERLDLLNMLALTPFDLLFKKFSWGMRLGFEPVRDIGADENLQATFNAGAGWTFDPFRNVLVYALAKAEIASSFEYVPRYRFGPIAATGALIGISDRLSFKLGAEYHQPVLGFTSGYYQASAEGRVSTSRNTDVRLQYELFQTESQGGVALHVYY